MLSAVVAATAWGWRLRRGRRERSEPGSDAGGSRDLWWVAAAVPIGLFVLATAHTIWSAPETGADNLAYHLPRLGYWQQQRAVAPFVAGNVRAGSFPPNGNVLQLPPVLFLGHDRFCGLVQLAAAALTSAAIHGLARGLGATTFGAAMAALCWFAIPCMLEQAGRSLVDVTASFFVAAAAFFLARFPAGAFGPLSTLACVAIAAGVKTPTLVLGLPLAAAALWRLRRDHPRLLARVALASPMALLALGGFYHLECARVWSDPNGLASVRWIVLSPSLASLGKNAEMAALPFLALLGSSGAGSLPRAAWSAATGYGFGLGWLAMGALTGALLAVAALRTPRGARAWAALWALGFGGALVLCFALRHQDAVLRFLLPAAALLTPTFAWTFDRAAGGAPRGASRSRRSCGSAWACCCGAGQATSAPCAIETAGPWSEPSVSVRTCSPWPTPSRGSMRGREPAWASSRPTTSPRESSSAPATGIAWSRSRLTRRRPSPPSRRSTWTRSGSRRAKPARSYGSGGPSSGRPRDWRGTAAPGPTPTTRTSCAPSARAWSAPT